MSITLEPHGIFLSHFAYMSMSRFPNHCRPGAKYIEKYSNTLQLLSLINDYTYITITITLEM